MTTKDDEQAREDWEGLTHEAQRLLLSHVGEEPEEGFVKVSAAAIDQVHVRQLVASRITDRGQRCAAYGRKVTGGT